MYTDFYRLSARPFQLTPDPAFYFSSATHQKAMAYLTYGLAQGEGFIVITGEVGAGKTTLVGHLMETIDKSKLIAARIVTTQLDADNMLRMVASAFGVPIEAADKSTLITRLESHLRTHHREGRRALLVVDEAQNLPVSALEELRMLSNFQEGTTALLQTFLLGQPEFRFKIASPELEQLRQRVIATHHLEAMTREEIPAYVEHRLRLVGWREDPVFTPAAYDAIFAYSDGVPRRLNNLCSRVLLFGALEERHEIDVDIVAEVVEDLQRDLAPGAAPPPSPSTVGSAPAAPAVLSGIDGDRLRALEVRIAKQERAIRSILDLLDDWAQTAEAAE
ncbi:MAG: AAA family ATPase [Alphaproteobacteria bacterium]|nr:AAA family ATPase [Alphaproteobacteria bacterium]